MWECDTALQHVWGELGDGEALVDSLVTPRLPGLGSTRDLGHSLHRKAICLVTTRTSRIRVVTHPRFIPFQWLLLGHIEVSYRFVMIYFSHRNLSHVRT